MSNARSAWSPEERKFAASFKKIEEMYKKNHDTMVTLTKLATLLKKIDHYLCDYPNSPASNTMKIVVFSMQSRIFDEQGKPEEAELVFEVIREHLKKPHLLSPDNTLRLLREYSDFLAFSGKYQQAFEVGNEALLPNAAGETPKDVAKIAALQQHLNLLQMRLHQSFDWQRHMLEGDRHFEQGQYDQAEKYYRAARIQLQALLDIMPEIIKVEPAFRQQTAHLFDRLADAYSHQENYRDAHHTRREWSEFYDQYFNEGIGLRSVQHFGTRHNFYVQPVAQTASATIGLLYNTTHASIKM